MSTRGTERRVVPPPARRRAPDRPDAPRSGPGGDPVKRRFSHLSFSPGGAGSAVILAAVGVVVGGDLLGVMCAYIELVVIHA